MNQIELRQTNEVDIDLLEAILRQKFPDKTIKRQNWGINAPFVKIKMNFWITVVVAISQKPSEDKTIVLVNDGTSLGAWFLLGWPAYWIFRKDHKTNVMNVVREGLREKTNVEFLD